MQSPTFVLDAYQRVAIDHLDAGRSVIVSAPTGAGKTVVAEHALRAALARGDTSVYTTPLKALSNQKRADLARTLGVPVGLITGDRVDNPHAPVVVMTTEVLRALLLSRAALAERLGVIVLDEFHWIQDPQRGGVWEEVVIAAAKETTLVCLSATLPGAGVVHEWMTEVHGPTSLVEETARPVSLTHLYALGNVRRDPPALVPLFDGDRPNPTAELLDGVRVRRGDDSPLRRRERDPNRRVPPERLDLLDVLNRENKLPAIWFLLSRAGCDRAVDVCVDQRIRLTDLDAGHAIRALAYDATASLSEGDRAAIGFDAWLDALVLGVSAHHGGLAPVQREVVEAAFARELIKVVFATETLAVGVNLPARSVVIERVVRPERQGGGLLSVAEFAQLSGRAGRRGIDTEGFVVLPWSPDASFAQLTALAKGGLPTLTSHFRPTPAMVASFARDRSEAGLAGFVGLSLRAYLARRQAQALRANLATLLLDAVDDDDPDGEPREETSPVGLDHVEPGNLIVDPARPAVGVLAVVACMRRRRLDAVDVVGEDARRTTYTARDFRAAPVVVGHIALPEPGTSPRGYTRLVWELLREAPRAVPLSRPEPPVRDRRRDADRQRVAVRELRRRIRAVESELADELDCYVELLRMRGHIDGWRPTRSGTALARLLHDAGLLVAECLRAGLFDGLSAPEVAALASCFTPRGASAEHALRAPTAAVASAHRAAEQLVRELNIVEDEFGLPYTPAPNAAMAGAIYRWVASGDLGHALRGTDVRPGDLVREARQVGELLDQLSMVASPQVASICATAIAALNRGIVIEPTVGT